MRLVEFAPVKEQQLDEIDVKRAMTAGALALATGIGGSNLPMPSQNRAPATEPVATKKEQPAPEKKALDPKLKKFTDIVVKKYNINYELASEIVTLAKKHEKKLFPRVEDLLAIIGIESSFNPQAVSGLRTDPAVGLTQIRPNIWGLDAEGLMGDIEKQISASSDILSKYNRHLNNKEDAVHAYNVGITAFQRGDYNPNYVAKFANEKQLYR
jgi:hypothetical protein